MSKKCFDCRQIDRLNIYRTPSPVEHFNMEISKPSYGTSDVVSFRTDIYMLFNQHRLDRMSAECLVTYLNNHYSGDNALNSIRNKLSDKQLSEFVKSRYIQSRSELLGWSDYIDANYEKLRKELDDMVRASDHDDQNDDKNVNE
nr:MAG: internal scaffolding protein [Microvirus Sku18]